MRNYENEYWEAQWHINELYVDLKEYRSHVSRIAKIALALSNGMVQVADVILASVDAAEKLTLEGQEATGDVT